MEKRYEDQMKELNSDLIHIIETTIKEARNKRDDYQWNNPENWFRVLESLKEYHEKLSDDITQYAEVQVGLAKFLDYYSMKWMEKEDVEKIQKLVSQIVSLSLSIIILSQNILSSAQYQPHDHTLEDGACKIGKLGARYIATGDVILQGWPTLPIKDAVNFLFQPRSSILVEGDRIYRILEEGINNPYGNWWFHAPLPKSKKEWRSQYAVSEKWNKDNNYIETFSTKPIAVWKGTAASQRVPMSTCILPGGVEQIWIDQNTLKQILHPQLQYIAFPKP